MNALIFCQDASARKEIESALFQIGFRVESWRNSDTVAERAVQTRPDLLVFFVSGDNRWVAPAIAEVHRSSPRTKILYATGRPCQEDAEILEQGVFYYAGNAPLAEVLEAAKAVASQSGMTEREAQAPAQEHRYQIRLRPGESLAQLLASALLRICGALKDVPGWDRLEPAEVAALEKGLRDALGRSVTTYDLCGLKAGCYETASPAGWNYPPDPAVADPHAWEEVRILQTELKRGLGDFSDALEAAALRALCREAGRADTAKKARQEIHRAIQEVFGPRVFRAVHGECDICEVVKYVDPWSIGAR